MNRRAYGTLVFLVACGSPPAATAPVASASVATASAPPPCPSVPSAAPVASATASATASASATAPAPSASVSIATSSSASVRPPVPPEPPIPATPLAGTVDGRAFTVAAAIAVSDPENPGGKVVWLFDRPVACGAKLPPPGVRAVSFSAPWEAGVGFGAESMSSGAKPSFYSVRGEVAEVTAPRARMLVRVRSNAIDVAGEVRPTACP